MGWSRSSSTRIAHAGGGVHRQRQARVTVYRLRRQQLGIDNGPSLFGDADENGASDGARPQQYAAEFVLKLLKKRMFTRPHLCRHARTASPHAGRRTRRLRRRTAAYVGILRHSSAGSRRSTPRMTSPRKRRLMRWRAPHGYGPNFHLMNRHC